MRTSAKQMNATKISRHNFTPAIDGANMQSFVPLDVSFKTLDVSFKTLSRGCNITSCIAAPSTSARAASSDDPLFTVTASAAASPAAFVSPFNISDS